MKCFRWRHRCAKSIARSALFDPSSQTGTGVVVSSLWSQYLHPIQHRNLRNEIPPPTDAVATLLGVSPLFIALSYRVNLGKIQENVFRATTLLAEVVKLVTGKSAAEFVVAYGGAPFPPATRLGAPPYGEGSTIAIERHWPVRFVFEQRVPPLDHRFDVGCTVRDLKAYAASSQPGYEVPPVVRLAG
jgi:hypothetical protein